MTTAPLPGPASRDLRVRLQLARAAFTLKVDLVLPGQGTTVVFGHSGSGKTTLLRCIAGLERPQEAQVYHDEEIWHDTRSGIFLPTHQRAIGYVFQEASLFEHLSVRGNLRYGLKRSRSADAAHTLGKAIGLLGIGHLLERRVQNLSGGEKQRVAMARALATQPRLLLLDEPLAALDAARRREILPWLTALQKEFGLPMVYVTHSVEELSQIADHVVVLDQGQVQVHGPVTAVLSALDTPLSRGEDAGALLRAIVTERSDQWQLLRAEFDGGAFWLPDSGAAMGTEIRLRIRARDVSLSLTEPEQTSIQNHCPATIEAMTTGDHPSQMLLRVRCGSTALLARVTRRAVHELQLKEGCHVWVQVKTAAMVA